MTPQRDFAQRGGAIGRLAGQGDLAGLIFEGVQHGPVGLPLGIQDGGVENSRPPAAQNGLVQLRRRGVGAETLGQPEMAIVGAKGAFVQIEGDQDGAKRVEAPRRRPRGLAGTPPCSRFPGSKPPERGEPNYRPCQRPAAGEDRRARNRLPPISRRRRRPKRPRL